MQKLIQHIDRAIIAIGNLISLFIILIAICVTLEIIIRMVSGRPLNWTFETSLFLFGGYLILCGGYAYINDSHVRMDFFYSRMSKRTQSIMDLITFPIFIFFSSVFLWLGVEWVLESWKYHEISQSLWGPSLIPIKLTIPIGFFLLMAAGISQCFKSITYLLNSKKGHQHG